MILLIGSQKGGCGKSTTAASICAELAAQGKDVVLVDADRQSTAANWAADRQGNEALPIVHCIQKYDNIRQTLLDLDKRYGFVVVDAAGRDSRELRTGMTAANVLLVPFRPSQPDLDTLPYMQEGCFCPKARIGLIQVSLGLRQFEKAIMRHGMRHCWCNVSRSLLFETLFTGCWSGYSALG